MGFEYDPAKAAANLTKHGISLADAEGVFQDPFSVCLEDWDAPGEQRFIAIGMGSAGSVLVVAYTHRGEHVRAISARRASRKEQRDYESGVRLF